MYGECCVPGCDHQIIIDTIVDTPCQECADTLRFAEWLIELKKTILPCPFCKSEKVTIQNTGYKVLNPQRLIYLACIVCKAYGPDRPSVAEAIRAWNTRFELP
jgi:Lar family restriction alleviation protein